jgi:N-acetylglucosaminyl-diphospho-decaprenol L-rhamnosyltransferase
MTPPTAVVLNWNLVEMTVRCVRALLGDGLAPEDVVVVDNGSADDSVERLRAELAGIHLLALPQNIGYARASNAGTRERPDADAYLLLNNDAFVHRPGSVALLLSSLDRPRVGIAVPRLLNQDLSLQPSVVPLRSPPIAIAMASGASRLIPNRWQPHWSTHWDHSQSREVDAAAGTVTAVRGDLWRQLGGYAEREIMFSEDIDLCWRVRKLGYRTWFEHDAEFVHLGDASGGDRSDARRAEMVAESDASMIRTELGRASAATTIWALAAGYAARYAIFAATGNKSRAAGARAAFRGYRKRTGARKQ